jgi:hypothetical protein
MIVAAGLGCGDTICPRTVKAAKTHTNNNIFFMFIVLNNLSKYTINAIVIF